MNLKTLLGKKEVMWIGPVDRKVYLLLVFFCILLQGCASTFLPSSKKITISPWNSFEQVKTDFDKIIPYKTTVDDLKKLRFDPLNTPNIEILTYLDIMERFLTSQAITLDDLDSGLQDCIKSKNGCKAYEIKIRWTKRKRYGNVLFDLLNFTRNTREFGWEFISMIVLNNDMVVYKISGGTPNYIVTEERKNPLGPLQESEGFFVDVVID